MLPYPIKLRFTPQHTRFRIKPRTHLIRHDSMVAKPTVVDPAAFQKEERSALDLLNIELSNSEGPEPISQSIIHPFAFHRKEDLPVCSVKSFPLIGKNRSSFLGLPPVTPSTSDFHGLRIVNGGNGGRTTPIRQNPQFPRAQARLTIGKAHKWWEKGVQPNMKEISSAQDLVESLLNAGDKLVVVDFFSPGCGGCKALHPKICQLAEMNPDVLFLQVNYEEHKSMCYSLNVHVLPFFRFYRGSEGRLCSFSCTNATIKKFKDALAKHSPARCSLGPPKGLEEKELLALASNKDLSFTFVPKPMLPDLQPLEHEVVMVAGGDRESAATAAAIASPPSSPAKAKLSLSSVRTKSSHQDSEEMSLLAAGR
ncbi:hypothetical protein Nepgr_023402 [Nepenthes gracilis]|uniref:Thioredoxin domain-containing protein n=1 Tax=Nepenthes gracilis TaxID=150966 RepID=A0AAD3T168_NEPGR|nr:hypothetical protein Nepgr_023402 [Nepenthes gracilis]